MRNHRSLVAVLAVGLLFTADLQAQGGKLFERVAGTLRSKYFDADYRRQTLPSLIESFRPFARQSETLDDERLVVHAFLSRIPASHLSIYSEDTLDELLAELAGKDRSRFGLALVELEGLYFVGMVLEGGPAEQSGIRRGDRVLEVDGAPIGQSPRLDWRADDAYLPDPPVHRLLVGDRPTVSLAIEREPGNREDIVIEATPYSAWKAARASVRIEEHQGERIGYVHFWYIFHSKMSAMLEGLFREEFADCSALVVDLRGRGGNAATAQKLIRTLEGKWDKPIVALIDRGTRSAKEVIAYELKRRKIALLLGEKTPGAVIPATFERVGSQTVLMFPSFTLGDYTRLIEHIGVAPDIVIEDVLPFSGGKDPIREAGFVAAALAVRGEDPRQRFAASGAESR